MSRPNDANISEQRHESESGSRKAIEVKQTVKKQDLEYRRKYEATQRRNRPGGRRSPGSKRSKTQKLLPRQSIGNSVSGALDVHGQEVKVVLHREQCQATNEPHDNRVGRSAFIEHDDQCLVTTIEHDAATRTLSAP